MKLCVLMPSEEYRNQAGARIRYGRLLSALQAAGHELTLRAMGGFNAGEAEHDIYLFSKVNDAQALICAYVLRQRGKLVGVDLFDDYFSQWADSRFARFRVWLATIIENIDFVLCSTPSMANIARRYRKDIPIHVMNDPLEGDPNSSIGEDLASKLSFALETREIRLAWFGMGDNPHFRVGLSDLASCANILAQLRASQWSVSFRVLTNARALTVDGLALLRKLDIPFELELWSEEKEQSLLRESMVCLLPVNAQNFSIAKSLNRAITALSSACQVISPGFPLYDPLHPLIYATATDFLDDLAQGQLRFRADQTEVFAARMEALASVDREAQSLLGFLAGLPPVRSGAAMLFAVVHGVVTRGDIGKLTRGLGGLSVASPFCSANLGFDVRFLFEEGGVQLACLVSEKALPKLEPELQHLAEKHGKIGNENYWRISLVDHLSEALLQLEALPVPVQLSRYSEAMNQIDTILPMLFGPLQTIVSELSPLPFRDIDLQRQAHDHS